MSFLETSYIDGVQEYHIFKGKIELVDRTGAGGVILFIAFFEP